jgi:hypothetical protein
MLHCLTIGIVCVPFVGWREVCVDGGEYRGRKARRWVGVPLGVRGRIG